MKLSNFFKIFKDGIIIISITAIGLLFICAGVDLVAYFAMGVRAPGYGADYFFEDDSRLGKKMRSNISGVWHRYRDGSQFPIETNEHGFADQSRSVSKSIPRVALLGDSTAQFWEMARGDRAHNQLQQKLGSGWEVLNFGMRGYGLDQSLLLYETKVRPYQPDIVVLNICINDVWDHARQVGKPYFVIDNNIPDGLRLAGVPVIPAPELQEDKGLHRFLWQKSFSLRYLGLVRHPDLKRHYPLHDHFELRPLKKNYNTKDTELARLTQHILSRFINILQADGVKVILVEMPYRPVLSELGQERIIRRYGDVFDFERWTRLLEQVAEETEVPIISMSKVIVGNSLDPNQLFHPEDQLHVNARGAQAYVQAVLEKIKALGWLDG